jgi:HSP20 family molecular chaperone IbpA
MSNHSLEAQKEEAQAPEGVERTRPGRTYVPRVDIYELEDEVVLLADVPGVDENGLDITLEKNTLTINGYVHFEPPQGYDLAYAEYGIGNYYRTFSLSDEVDKNDIEATIKNGVLRLIMPKAKEAKTRKVSVRAG